MTAKVKWGTDDTVWFAALEAQHGPEIAALVRRYIRGEIADKPWPRRTEEDHMG